jgi:starch phosphorylase
MHVRQYLVLPKLPERIKALQELANNLWYSWNWDLVKLFIRLDPEMWEGCAQNPIEMLSRLPQDTLQRAAQDEGFLTSLDRVYERYQQYQSRKKWFDYKYSEFKNSRIAYFSLEYGLDTGLPVYSGGLGVLSGDTLKSASDLGLPFVGIGLLYRYGYFHQILSADGWQQERYIENDWYHMPVDLVKDENDRPLRVSVDIDGSPVSVQLWKVAVGGVPLYLLDTNIPDNPSKHREITSVLYGGDKDMRIRQEIVLGVGGVKTLRALNLQPTVFHMNEGHAWFLALERVRGLMEESRLSLQEALQYVWATSIFTTHTPVPAGNEKFETVLIHRYLGRFISELGMSWKEFVALGRVFPEDESEQFGMTVAALKTSAFANGVSKLHGAVARQMWRNIWPGLPKEEVPIRSITNGVHPSSWISHDLKELYESYFGPSYIERPGAPEVWRSVDKIPDAELWRVHNRRRERLIFFARKLLKQQFVRRGGSQIAVQRADQVLDPQAFTIGFARRFSTYKRGNLIFSNADRLERIVNNPKFPVQILFSGKAHPLDNPGKEIIKQLIGFCSQERFRNRVIFLEDYDINVARYLVQGADLWLNNPRRPQEASGTSGMKAALNGVLNASVLDGWWDEAYTHDVGFRIGNAEDYDNVDTQDHFDAESLYNTLERDIIPLFYEKNEIGLPTRWIAKMKASIRMAGEQFTAQRMIMDYSDCFYIPSLQSAAKLAANDFLIARQVTGWVERMSKSWDSISIKDVEVPELASTLYVGQNFPISVKVHLGQIRPEDVQVEIVAGTLDSQEQIRNFAPAPARLDESATSGSDGTYVYRGDVTCNESGRFGVTARIIPKNENLPHTIKPKLISWW